MEEYVIMWTVVYMAQSKEIASELEHQLANEGILVKQRPISKNKDIDKDKDKNKGNEYYEILVPEAEIEEAHGVIIEKGF